MQSKSFAASARDFYRHLQVPPGLPKGIDPLFPFTDPVVACLVDTFFQKFYTDSNQRTMLIGINPGRFGAGITGINFTAPRQLSESCGIMHALGNTSELSAEFIYAVIHAFGGPAAFFRNFYIAAVSPVGFMQNGRNMNYYDDPKLERAIIPFAVNCMQQQLRFGIYREKAICIGGDKNFKFLQSLNERHGFFKELIPLPHPRFIMQYRRSSKESYITEYLSAFELCLPK